MLVASSDSFSPIHCSRTFLTSCPAERESSFWSCRWWGQPTGQWRCWQRSLCGRCIPQSSSAHRSAVTRVAWHIHLAWVWDDRGGYSLVKGTLCSLPTAVRRCPPSRWLGERPTRHECPPASTEGSHFQPKSQSRWRNQQLPASFLKSGINKELIGWASCHSDQSQSEFLLSDEPGGKNLIDISRKFWKQSWSCDSYHCTSTLLVASKTKQSGSWRFALALTLLEPEETVTCALSCESFSI